MKRVAFDLKKAIPAAWDRCWARNVACRNSGSDWRGSSYYLCARDIEDQVRAFAKDTLEGKPWGTTDISYGYGYGIRVAGDLQNEVRDWLLHNPNITGHNFGRGHISGMRFRPIGEPLNEAERKTLAAKAERKANPRPAPVHYSTRGYGGMAECVAAKRAKRATAFARMYSSGRSRAHTDSDISRVTCKQCLNLLNHDSHRAS